MELDAPDDVVVMDIDMIFDDNVSMEIDSDGTDGDVDMVMR